MGKRTLSILGSLLLSTAGATPGAAGRGTHQSSLPHYVLFDVGTFGGGLSGFCYPNCRQLNSKGEAVGINTTSLPDPLDPLCFIDCHVDPAFLWKNGGTNALGSLQKGAYAAWSQGINDKGDSAGFSENGAIDQDIGIFEGRAVLWVNRKAKDLGTLGGTQSNAWMINNSGQVVADASTSDTNDPFLNIPQANCKWLPNNGPSCGQLDFATNTLFLPVTTTMHAAIWMKSSGLVDIGTLGGPDSSAIDINDAGQIVGWSYTSYEAGASGVPDTHPFVWQNGKMTDLGSPLGGTFAAATLINKQGQIAGVANTAGDAEMHAVIWDNGKFADRGTLGSDYGHPNWMNDAGDIVGYSRTADQLGRPFVYWHNGDHMINLGTLGDDPQSEADGINNKGVIVGGTFDHSTDTDLRAWVSDQGGQITDLNTLIRKPHGIHVTVAHTINDRGVIAAQGMLKNGEQHAVILVPENDFEMLAQMNAVSNSVSQIKYPHGARTSAPGPHRSCVPGQRIQPTICKRG